VLDHGTVGSEAVDFTLQDLSGVEHTLSDYRGDVVLLAFFAAW
jgi:peroxiredoxin